MIISKSKVSVGGDAYSLKSTLRTLKKQMTGLNVYTQMQNVPYSFHKLLWNTKTWKGIV